MTHKLLILGICIVAGLIAVGGGRAQAVTTVHCIPNTGIDVSCDHADADILVAVGHDASGDTVLLGPGTHTTTGQVVIDVDLTIKGESASQTVIKPGYDTGNSGDSRGWFLVDDGVTFDLADVTLDGTGNLVHQAIRQKGSGSVSRVAFNEIKYNESGPDYAGLAVVAFGTGPVDVIDSTFKEIGRVGALYFGSGVSGSTFSGNTYMGKGNGNFLDYALDISAGAVIDVSGNLIRDNRGVASSDGSTSAGILVTTYYGAGTQATITCNLIAASTRGIHVGYDDTDTSVVAANLNNFTRNGTAVYTTAPLVDAEENWWDDASGPSGSGPGTGDAVGDNVDFDPFLSGPSACAPSPVGGIAELVVDGPVAPASPGGSGSGFATTLYAAIAAIATASAALVVVGWYSRRRLLR